MIKKYKVIDSGFCGETAYKSYDIVRVEDGTTVAIVSEMSFPDGTQAKEMRGYAERIALLLNLEELYLSRVHRLPHGTRAE